MVRIQNYLSGPPKNSYRYQVLTLNALGEERDDARVPASGFEPADEVWVRATQHSCRGSFSLRTRSHHLRMSVDAAPNRRTPPAVFHGNPAGILAIPEGPCAI